MTLDELRKALERIPDDAPHNRAKRAEIIKQITKLQNKQEGEKE